MATSLRAVYSEVVEDAVEGTLLNDHFNFFAGYATSFFSAS